MTVLQALANLGHKVSDPTVGNILRRHGVRHASERRRQTTWAQFIRRHKNVLWATDFFTAEVWSASGLVTVNVLFFIHLQTRKLVFGGLTLLCRVPCLVERHQGANQCVPPMKPRGVWFAFCQAWMPRCVGTRSRVPTSLRSPPPDPAPPEFVDHTRLAICFAEAFPPRASLSLLGGNIHVDKFNQ